MLDIRICNDLDEAGHLWQRCWPRDQIFDLWEVRKCFQDVEGHMPHFLVARENGVISGLLALSWIQETGEYVHFPGETWQGKTWLEQNRVLARNARALRAMISHIPGGTHIRYLTRDAVLLGDCACDVDETGYLFYPYRYNFSFDSYFAGFSSKSRKKINREIKRFENLGVAFQHGCLADIDRMFDMNRASFGDSSFFSNPGFYHAFTRLLSWLAARHMLRVTTVKVAGKTAAVDVGAVYNGGYTVLAGGVNPEFPGIAKLINFHHLKWACDKRLSNVDFLCGDYGWKERFHLTPRPFYRIMVPQAHGAMLPRQLALYATA